MDSQYVVMKMSAQDIHPWTESEIQQMIDDSFSEDVDKASVARHAFETILFSMHRLPLSLVKEYLGEDPCVDGGTIGEPVTQKEYVHILHEKLKHLCIETMRWYFSPPLSPDVCFKVALTKFVWYYMEYHN